MEISKDNQKTFAVKGLVVIEDAARRDRTEAKGMGSTDWNVTVPGSPVCEARISFKAAASAAVAEKIALS